jgi:hypothetical protein
LEEESKGVLETQRRLKEMEEMEEKKQQLSVNGNVGRRTAEAFLHHRYTSVNQIGRDVVAKQQQYIADNPKLEDVDVYTWIWRIVTKHIHQTFEAGRIVREGVNLVQDEVPPSREVNEEEAAAGDGDDARREQEEQEELQAFEEAFEEAIRDYYNQDRLSEELEDDPDQQEAEHEEAEQEPELNANQAKKVLKARPFIGMYGVLKKAFANVHMFRTSTCPITRVNFPIVDAAIVHNQLNENVRLQQDAKIKQKLLRRLEISNTTMMQFAVVAFDAILQDELSEEDSVARVKEMFEQPYGLMQYANTMSLHLLTDFLMNAGYTSARTQINNLAFVIKKWCHKMQSDEEIEQWQVPSHISGTE